MDRKQRVVIGQTTSNWKDVLSGVPQGSVLGPLLFIIFINDMPDLVINFCKLFADDTKLIGIIRSLGDKDSLQEDLNRLVKWSHTWLMSFNEEKCKAMYFDKREKGLLDKGYLETMYLTDIDLDPIDPHNKHFKFKMTDAAGVVHTLGETTQERDLGVITDNRLNWFGQIELVKAKAYAALNTLKQSFLHWTPFTFRVLFGTFVRPHLEYCATAWKPHNIGDIISLESVQRTASKLVPQIRTLPYGERLKALKMPYIFQRMIRGDVIQHFKITKGLNIVHWLKPTQKYPSASQTGPAGGIRREFHQKMPEKTNCKQREHFFTNRVLEIWNQLPNETVESESVLNFEIKLDVFLKNYFKTNKGCLHLVDLLNSKTRKT